jgi:hypothetical protein
VDLLTTDSNNIPFLLPYGHDPDDARIARNDFIEDPKASNS